MTPDDLRRASDENLIRAFELVAPHPGLGGERRSFGAVEAVFIGVEHPFYNPVFVLDSRATIKNLDASIGWIRERGREPSVQVREDLRERFEPWLLELGYVADPWITPGMALDAIPATTPTAPAELTIEVFGADRRATKSDARRWDDWHTAFGNSQLFRQVMPLAALSNDDLLFAVGHDEEGPVCCSLAVRSNYAIGVYAVGTLARSRRRGYGSAITWAVIQAAKSTWGVNVAVLQSSEMGFGIYERMGFWTVCRYVEFDPPKRPMSGPAPQG